MSTDPKIISKLRPLTIPSMIEATAAQTDKDVNAIITAVIILCLGGNGKISFSDLYVEFNHECHLSAKLPIMPFSRSIPAKMLANKNPDISSNLAIWTIFICLSLS